MSSTSIIYPKPCSYDYWTRICRNTLEYAYFEGFNKTKHQCLNRSKSATETTKKPNSNYYKNQSRSSTFLQKSNVEFIRAHIWSYRFNSEKSEVLSQIV